jgi:hypothetical protein
MIITKEMFDEFVESAENHSILWTDTLALIGVTVGDVPDVDVIEALAAKVGRLREMLQRNRIAWENCLELQLLPPRHSDTAKELVAFNAAALAQEAQP